MIQHFEVRGQSGTSHIHVGEKLDNVPSFIPDTDVFILTDDHLNALYGHRFPEGHVIPMGTGESIKTLDTVTAILSGLMDKGCDRSSFILGIGGGIVCDITGFAASIYMRGVDFGFVSTSLLSQVDASVGGKNGVNFNQYKNIIGTFRQPRFVICDPELLKTLPRPEIANGLAEILKHALIADAHLFRFLEEHASAALALDTEVLQHLISTCVAIKSRIVQSDETETGLRKILNFGHTIGHAIEKQNPLYGHGRAVARGMAAAIRFSRNRGLLTPADEQRIRDLMTRLELPAELPRDAAHLMEAIVHDKKKQGRYLDYVFLDAIGSARVERLPLAEVRSMVISA